MITSASILSGKRENNMCIEQSVGIQGANKPSDVKTIQLILNDVRKSGGEWDDLEITGKMSSQLSNAIRHFQHQHLKIDQPDGRVDPHGKTLLALQTRLQEGFNITTLQGIMVNSKLNLIIRYFRPLLFVMDRYEIHEPLQKAHFLAQVGHESGELKYSEEIASGSAYEGRLDLGNVKKNDGAKFKGRGLIQLTGRNNYTKYSQYKGIDFTKGGEERIAAEAEYCADVAGWFWRINKLNPLADKDDLLTITKKVNGGTNGLKDRERLLKRAKFFLKI